MKNDNKASTTLLFTQGILATIITILMFYPMFGGTLTIFNGVFVYFSYFLAVIILLIYMVVDFIQLLSIKKEKDKEVQKEKTLQSFVIFSFTSLVVMIGLMQGRYIIQPVLGIFYIVLELIYLYRIVLTKKSDDNYVPMSLFDIIKRVVFYLASIFLLIGNQPFESMGLPVATTLLLLLDIIHLIIFVKRAK